MEQDGAQRGYQSSRSLQLLRGRDERNQRHPSAPLRKPDSRAAGDCGLDRLLQPAAPHQALKVAPGAAHAATLAERPEQEPMGDCTCRDGVQRPIAAIGAAAEPSDRSGYTLAR